jgi:hypothetical protein
MYAATTKDEGNAADGRFSTACNDSIPEFSFPLIYFLLFSMVVPLIDDHYQISISL